MRIQRGIEGPDLPGKLQVIWVSIEISNLDPLVKVGPPWKILDPLWIHGKVFSVIKPLNPSVNCKIS